MKRRVLYVSGTRADFGLMAQTLAHSHAHAALELGIVVTGMHLSERFGRTELQIEAAGLPIRARISVELEPATGATMGRAMGAMVAGFATAFEQLQPEIVLLLGDRGEMLAGAIAAAYQNIVVVHIHGGERSGTVDEPVRHAISKLAHYHFVATDESRRRLIRMGEQPERIHVVGAPGLDDIQSAMPMPRDGLCRGRGLDAARPVALLIHHPVVQRADAGGAEVRAIVDALAERELQVLAVRPNSDAGSDHIWAALDSLDGHAWMRIVTSLPRCEFIGWMAAADFMIGNSSAGIIEAASFGTPVVNVGPRQNLRERNANVIDTEAEPAALSAAISRALATGRLPRRNVYGDGNTGPRIAALLASLPLGHDVLMKCNAY